MSIKKKRNKEQDGARASLTFKPPTMLTSYANKVQKDRLLGLAPGLVQFANTLKSETYRDIIQKCHKNVEISRCKQGVSKTEAFKVNGREFALPLTL